MTVFDNGVKPLVEAWKTVENTEINSRDEVFNGEKSASDWANGLSKSNEKLEKLLTSNYNMK